MSRLRAGRGWALAALLAAAGAAPAGSPRNTPELPGTSLYRAPILLETSDGSHTRLDAFRGRPLLITMFYSQCSSVCPLLTVKLKRVDEEVPAGQRAGLRILMVSLDPARDSPAVLAAYAAEHHIDAPRWVLARAAASDVRLLAAMLGFRYRHLPDGGYDHSSSIVLLGADGVPSDRTSELLGADDRFVASTARLLRETEARIQ